MYNLIFNTLRKLHFGVFLLVLHPRSALREYGWFGSFRKKKVIDKHGKPIPWWTYSFIDFISDRLKPGMKVLEFGSGYSTIWLSNLGLYVDAVEDYPSWAAEISAKLNVSSKIISVNSIANYAEYSESLSDSYDILIIDNLGNRMECLLNTISHLNAAGVVIWDNTDGPDWPEIKRTLQNLDFREVSFSGMVAQELNNSKTTLFYRTNNCFGI